MRKNLFCESFFTIYCILGNIIKGKILADICITEYGFMNEKFAETVCQVLEIEPQRLIKPNQYKDLMVELPNLLSMPFTLY